MCAAPDMITDRLGRRFEKLRVSLINDCNFSCTYCVRADTPEHTVVKPAAPHPSPVRLNTNQFIQAVTLVHDVVGLKSIRLTGGEPLLYPDIENIIRKIKSLGINDIRLTTNAYYLKGMAQRLRNAGLQAVNVSLDAVDAEVFFHMSNNPRMERVLEGIDAAMAAELHVKLNTVVMRGQNEHQILPLLEYAGSKGLVIRYLELMKMGHLYQNMDGHFFSQQEILAAIRSKYSIEEIPREKSATSNYWRAVGLGTFGIIANESSPFCGDCNRLRMDSYGNFYGCISSRVGIPLLNQSHSRADVIRSLKELLSHKQTHHFQGNEMTMRYIGG